MSVHPLLAILATLMLGLTTACAVAPPAPVGIHQDVEAATRADLGTRSGLASELLHVKVFAFNDFHGALERRSLSGRPVGGADVLAAYFAAEAQEVDGKIVLAHAGDQVGASPSASALLQDEPAISVLNQLGNQHCKDAKASPKRSAHRCNLVGTLGNHEFDEGVDEMLRLIQGGNHHRGPFLEAPWTGAQFPYVNANVVDAKTGVPILPPYTIIDVQGAYVGFIGAVLQETPSIVTAEGVASVEFLDEAQSINRYVAELKQQGVRAIVALVHQGTSQPPFAGKTGTAAAPLEGAIGAIVHKLDDEIDVVITGHAHDFTNQRVANQGGAAILVTQALSAGMAYADIDLTIDLQSGDVIEKSAEIITTWADEGPGLQPDQAVASLVSAARAAVAPMVSRVVGHSAIALTRESTPAGESSLGNLIADAQRSAMSTDLAFMNPGGIRSDLPAGEITWGALFSIQPFANNLVRMALTGAQIVELLNQQWSGANAERPRLLETSGIQYTWDASLLPEHRVLLDSVQIHGSPLALNTRYTVTVNSYLASGGDNFTVLEEGTSRVVGPGDLDALIKYIQNQPQPFSAKTQGRARRLN